MTTTKDISMTAARVATDELTLALLGLAEQGLRTHCSDAATHHLWLSERDAERALAALMCNGCCVLAECGDAADANGERFGAWSGRDYTRKPRTKQAA